MSHLLTLSECVAAHARTQPHKLAVRDSKRSLTYAQWNERCHRLANALLSLGLYKGDRVALLATNTIEWLEIYAALARAGLVAVPINFRLMGPEVAYIVQHAQARAFIVQQEFCALVQGLGPALPISAARCVHFGGSEKPPGWQSYEALMTFASTTAPIAGPATAHATAPALHAAPVLPSDLFALMYTSGTTGRPKGAMRNHEGNALLALATALEFGLTRDDTGLLVMPLCHANSLYFAVTFAMLGATIVVNDSPHFDPEALLALLARERITFTSLVPTHYTLMAGLPPDVKARYDLRRVGKLLVSSAPARKETKLAIFELFPKGRLFELYGSTEAGWVTVLRPEEQLDHLGSVGREWAGTAAVKLLGADGQEVQDGQVGELYSHTPFVFSGYLNDPQKTRECFAGNWCSVGDMARRDEQGYIHLVDRKSNMIISGGENIYPSEVEAVLAAHHAVQEVAVVGVPDEKWGETVLAAVVPRAGQAPTPDELQAWCRERLAGFKRPRAFAFITEVQLPRTATGKVQHRALREQLLAAGKPA